MRLMFAMLLVCVTTAAAWAQAKDAGGAPPAPTPPSAPHAKARAARTDAIPPTATPPAAGPACLHEIKVPIDPAAGPLHVGLKTYPRTLKLPDRTVVLTFDDGPSRTTTPAVLDALREACVHATFFLIGRHATEFADLARQEMKEGHTTGHHSQTHPSFTLRGFDTVSAEHDIETGIAADERAIYAEAASPAHPHTPFFRFPGFADTPELLAYLDQRGIAVFGADMWAADWLDMSWEHELARVLDLLDKAPHHNGIMLFHDTRPSTAQMLPYLLAELRARHYTIAHLVVDAKAKPPELTAPAKGWSAETERIIAHLRRPIVPGSHHAGEAGEAVVPGEGLGEGPR